MVTSPHLCVHEAVAAEIAILATFRIKRSSSERKLLESEERNSGGVSG